jgi:hypothetical protein
MRSIRSSQLAATRRLIAPILLACFGAQLGAAQADPAPAAIDRKVLIIGVDGMRPDAMTAANAPTFDSLIASGAVSYSCFAEDITISGPCWSSILTGVHRAKHGVRDNSFAGANYTNYPHFFKRLQDLCDATTLSIARWAPINTQIALTTPDVSQSGLTDANVASFTASYVASNNADVIFLHFDDVDAAGHASGFHPSVPQYLAAIERTDTYAGQVLAAIRARPTYANEDWLVIVTSDHGGTIDGTHGRNIPEHRLTPLIVSGLSSAVGTIITPDPELVDIPATVMTFLGLPIDPSWGWDGQAVGLNMANSPSRPFPCTPPPPPPLGACCLPNGTCVQLTREQCVDRRGSWAGLDAPCPPAGCELPVVVLTEDFESVVLGPNLDETLAGTNVWSATPPSGWSVDRSLMPAGGVREWRGWSIASRAWWSQAAGDQGRSQFGKGLGAVAIADPDEWFDLPRDPGLFDSSISTRSISLAGVKPGTATLYVDSSWLPEDNQTATISVRYDAQSPVTVLRWTSASGPDFKPDATNETIALPLNNPAGAAAMTITFRLSNAGNNWWWALDNLQVTAIPLATRRALLVEDFESVPLGPNVDETLAGDRVWSGAPPADWTFDDSGVPALNDPTRGTTEWKGWAITNRAWWTQAAADQRRSEFTRAIGAVAVADPDEWDDKGAPSTLGPYNAGMITKPIPLARTLAGSVRVAFDSSWRPEGIQRAQLTATFQPAGQAVTLLRWDSAPGPNFKPDATNERVEFNIANPAGATSMTLRFDMLDARNNWWWAIDNLLVTGVAPCPADFNADGSADFFDYLDFVSAFDANNPLADVNNDGTVDFFDYLDFVAAFDQGC